MRRKTEQVTTAAVPCRRRDPGPVVRLARLLVLPLLAVLLFGNLTASPALAERVADLPAPTGYVNDFAGVLSPSTIESVDQLCQAVDQQAHAQIAVVTIKSLPPDQSIEEFTTELEDKWKVGTKGTDRGVLMLLVMTPRRGRIEVGYGLEGVLNDAKVGDIGRSMVPAAQQGDYNTAVPLGVRQLAADIAADAGVTLTGQPSDDYGYPRRSQQVVQVRPWQVLIAIGGVVFVIILLVATGNTGILFFLLGNLLGGGFGGGGGRGNDGDGGGGFGGFGGGSSGGGGASGDF
ncbi:MAG: TPM domain-containing protein [Acidobacteriota bacterium]|nr:TPM domain-containing protein [Acidobacteriota bacterium]